MGGGNKGTPQGKGSVRGLSPRGRGKRGYASGQSDMPRSIPAWAGETTHNTKPSVFSPVYPRVGGGNSARTLACGVGAGLSPRGRGKRPLVAYGLYRPRSIPAWAGETLPSRGQSQRATVYPRVGGGNLRDSLLIETMKGLSPRGRGKRRAGTPSAYRARSIPAWAGETKMLQGALIHAGVYPRVGGGNSSASMSAATLLGLSPRGRGKPQQ